MSRRGSARIGFPSMKLILARHGKAAHNVAFENHSRGESAAHWDTPNAASPLVEAGVQQVRLAGKYLRERGIEPSAAYVSPTARTQATWQEMGFPGVTVTLDARLCEQNGGDFDRLPLSELQAERLHYKEQARHDPDARPPNGESIREHDKRARAWLYELLSRPEHRCDEDSTVVVVAHLGTIALIGRQCEGLSWNDFLARRPAHLRPENGSLIAYRRPFDAGQPWLREWIFNPKAPE